MRTKADIIDKVPEAHVWFDENRMEAGYTSTALLVCMHEYAKEVVSEILKLSLPLIPENEWVGQYAEYFKIDRSAIENLFNPNPPTINRE